MRDAASATRLDTSATVTAVPVRAQRKVCYEFDTTATDPQVAIPYLVVINGQVENKGKSRKLDNSRKINLKIDAGSEVALYLNSDVHPDHRHTPVYSVRIESNDVLVKIKEKTGHHANLQPTVGTPTIKPSPGPGKPALECYQAWLTGDIWMSVSHRYTEAEAVSLLSAATATEIKQAILSIYRGLKTAHLRIHPADATANNRQALNICFEEGGNPAENIANISTTADVLTRTHPWAFEALLSQAYKFGVTDMLVTSCWRPSFGSIAHRAGLGLDVCYIATAQEKFKINRIGLLLKGLSRNPNVSDAEKTLRAETMALQHKAQENKSDQALVHAADSKHVERIAEMRKHEPAVMSALREGLREHPTVRQLIDPWYIDLNTRNKNTRTLNEQQSATERGHAHHLHITIKEPKIYE